MFEFAWQQSSMFNSVAVDSASINRMSACVNINSHN